MGKKVSIYVCLSGKHKMKFNFVFAIPILPNPRITKLNMYSIINLMAWIDRGHANEEKGIRKGCSFPFGLILWMKISMRFNQISFWWKVNLCSPLQGKKELILFTRPNHCPFSPMYDAYHLIFSVRQKDSSSVSTWYANFFRKWILI